MKISSNLLKLKKIELDLAIAILGILAGISFLFESIIFANNHFHYFVVLFFPSLLYAFFRKKATYKIPSVSYSKNFILAWIAIFLILVFLITWISRTKLYYKSSIYFFLCSLATLPIILHIFGCDTKKKQYLWIILFEIIFLSVVVRYSIYYDSAGTYGQDPWWHTQWIKETIETGHITHGQYLINAYYNFPIFHLLNGIASIISLLSIHDAIFISTGIVGNCVIPSLFIFLIAKKIFSDKIALLSALVYSLSGYSIERGISIIPMTLGVSLFILILYTIFIIHTKNRAAFLILFLLFSLTLVLTHPLATLITFISLITIYIGNIIYNKIFDIKNNNTNTNLRNTVITLLSLIIVFGIVTVFVWGAKGADRQSFFERVIMPSIAHIFSAGKSRFADNSLRYSVPYIIALLESSTFWLLMFFAIFASLFPLSKKYKSEEKFSMILIFLALYGSIIISSILSIQRILPWRWYIFMMIPLSILGVAGLFKLLSFMKSHTVKLVGIGLVIISIIFLAQITPPVNQTSPLFYSGYSSSRACWTESELIAAKTLYEISCGNPITDLYYGQIIPYIIGHNNYSKMCSKSNSIFIWRNYYLNHPEWNDKYITCIHKGKYRSNYDPTKRYYITDLIKIYGIEIEYAPLIYTNGNVKAYPQGEE